MKPEVLSALKLYQSSLSAAPAAYPAFVSEDREAFNIISAALRHGALLDELVNSPETESFLLGVRLEAAHQVTKWGEAHDRGKSSENWFWLVGYLAGKCLRAAIMGDRTKALHHTISAAAACANWHRAIAADKTGSGVGDDRDMIEIARFVGVDAAAADERAGAPPYVHFLGGSGHGSGVNFT